MDEITIEKFKALFQAGQFYTGRVKDLGTVVRWEIVPVLSTSPSNNPKAFTSNALFQSDSIFPVIIPDPDSSKNWKKFSQNETNFISFLTTAETTVGYGGTGASIASLSKKALTLGPDYVVINEGGTVVKNDNQVFTTTGEIAQKWGKRFFISSVVLDIGIASSKTLDAYGNKISSAYTITDRNSEIKTAWEDAGISIGINTGIYVVGYFCPPAGAVLGILFLILTSNNVHGSSVNDYKKIHGTITPPDNTRVAKPIVRELQEWKPPHIEPKAPPVLKPGH